MEPRIPRNDSTPPSSPSPVHETAEEPTPAHGLGRKISESSNNLEQIENPRNESSRHTIDETPISEREVEKAPKPPSTWYGRAIAKAGSVKNTISSTCTSFLEAVHNTLGTMGTKGKVALANVVNRGEAVLNTGIEYGNSAINQIGSYGTYVIDRGVSLGARKLMASQAGIEFQLSDKEWQSLFEQIFRTVEGVTGPTRV